MPTVATREQIEGDFDAIARLMPSPPVLSAAERWVLGQVPRQRERAVDIGCGVGDVARLLARDFEAVDAIDLSAGMIAEARRRTAETSSVTFAVADMFDWLAQRPERYDFIVTIATLHHVDFVSALRAMRAALRPGGRLAVVDLYDRSGARHIVTNALAAAWNAAQTAALIARGRWSWQLHRAFREHGRNETYLPLAGVRRTAQEALPGATIRGTLLWRYTLTWDKPLSDLTSEAC